MIEIFMWLLGIATIIVVAPFIIEEYKTNKFLTKNKKQVKVIRAKQRQLPIYKCLTQFQICGLVVISVIIFSLFGFYNLADSIGYIIGIYALYFFFIQELKKGLSSNTSVDNSLSIHNLTYNKQEDEYTGVSKTGNTVYFKRKIVDDTTKLIENSTIQTPLTVATHHYVLQLNNIDKQLIEVCKDSSFINKIIEENKKDFFTYTDINLRSDGLSITILADAYSALGDIAILDTLFVKAFETSEELAQLILNEAENRKFY